MSSYEQFLKQAKQQYRRDTGKLVTPVSLGNESGIIYDNIVPGSGRVYVREVWSNQTLGPGFLVDGPIPANVPVQVGSKLRLLEVEEGVYELLSPRRDQIIPAGGVISDYDQTAIVNNTKGTTPTTAEPLQVTAQSPATTTVTIGSWTAVVSGTVYRFLGNIIDIATAGAGATSLIPSSGNMRYVVIFVKSDYATLEAFGSTERSQLDVPLNTDDLQECVTAATADSIPVWAIPLANAQTTITQTDINAGVDMRNWVNTSGGGGSSYYQTVQDNGTPATQQPILDFVDTATVTWALTNDGPGTRTKVEATASGGGGTSIGTRFDPFGPPSSPSAYDDEFSDSSVAGLWSTYDPGSIATISEDARGLLISVPNNGSGSKVAGLYQALPAGDFTIQSYVGGSNNIYSSGVSTLVGPTLWSGTGSGASIIQFTIGTFNGTFRVFWISYTAYNTPSANGTVLTLGYGINNLHMRIRRNSTNYYFDYSLDGINWQGAYTTATTLGFTPAYMGVSVNMDRNTTPQYGRFGYFRYTGSDVGFDGMIGGRRVIMGV